MGKKKSLSQNDLWITKDRAHILKKTITKFFITKFAKCVHDVTSWIVWACGGAWWMLSSRVRGECGHRGDGWIRWRGLGLRGVGRHAVKKRGLGKEIWSVRFLFWYGLFSEKKPAQPITPCRAIHYFNFICSNLYISALSRYRSWTAGVKNVWGQGMFWERRMFLLLFHFTNYLLLLVS